MNISKYIEKGINNIVTEIKFLKLKIKKLKNAENMINISNNEKKIKLLQNISNSKEKLKNYNVQHRDLVKLLAKITNT